MKSKRKLILIHTGIISLIAAYVILTWKGITECPSKLLFDFPCPFCGMTRAWISAMRLDFKSAFSYHPLFPLGIPIILFAGHQGRFKSIKKPIKDGILIFTAVAFLLCYIIRIFL